MDRVFSEPREKQMIRRVFIVEEEEVECNMRSFVLMCKNRNKAKMKDDQGANVVQKHEKKRENK